MFQLIFYKENTPHYDAGIAVDDVRFYDCPLPRPTADDECPTEEWRCSNKVLYMLISQLINYHIHLQYTHNV